MEIGYRMAGTANFAISNEFQGPLISAMFDGAIGYAILSCFYIKIYTQYVFLIKSFFWRIELG